jgi:hypothetical protein
LGVIPSDFTGVWVDWYRQGHKRAETEYRDGTEHGKRVWYGADGSVASETNYQYGKLHGKATSRRRRPGMEWQDHYVHGYREGKTTWWDEDGNVIAEGMFKRGRRWDGTFVEYVRGPVHVVNTYREGEIWNGKRWDRGDRMVQIFRHGVVVAREPSDHSFGGTLKDGKPWRGPHERWDNDRKRFVLKTYRNGVVVDVATEADIAAQQDAAQQDGGGSSKLIVVPLP